MNTSGYEKEFQDALERTDSWGLCAPYFKSSNGLFIDETSLPKLTASVQDVLGKTPSSQVSQQCFAVNFLIQKKLEKLLGTSLAYTLGYVEYNQRNVFYTPEEQLRELLGTSASMRPVNLHAWLTSPSYEIIDLTFFTTCGVVNNNPDCIGLLMAQHHSLYTKDLIHHPQIIGEDFLSAIGGMLQISWD